MQGLAERYWRRRTREELLFIYKSALKQISWTEFTQVEIFHGTFLHDIKKFVEVGRVKFKYIIDSLLYKLLIAVNAKIVCVFEFSRE